MELGQQTFDEFQIGRRHAEVGESFVESDSPEPRVLFADIQVGTVYYVKHRERRHSRQRNR